MSGTTIAYGDRPITHDNGFATFEFLQFLERLNKAANSLGSSGSGLQTQVTANTAAIDQLEGQVATLNSQVAAVAGTGDAIQGQINLLRSYAPSELILDVSGAIVLASGVASEIVQCAIPRLGKYILTGMVCLTGAGAVTFARAGISLTTATIDPYPGSFATGWFGTGASPGTLGVDLTIGSFTKVIQITTPSTAYLNVNATLSGTISAYGALIVWPIGA